MPQPILVRLRPKRSHLIFAAEIEILPRVAWVGPIGFDLFDGVLVAIRARFRKHQVILRVDHGGPARYLARANVGGEQIGAHLHARDSRDRRREC